MWVEILVVVAFVALAVLGLLAVRRRVLVERLQEHHDVAAACFAVIGGLYGIVLAFVLVSSWERFEEARERSEAEANAVADLQRHALGLPEPGRSTLNEQTLAYARSVVDREWPALARGETSEETQAIYEELWRTVLALEAGNDKQAALFQSTLAKLDDLADGRRDRLLYARVGLPSLVWGFLVVCAVVTVGFSYFFGVRQVIAQMLMIAVLAATIAAALVLIQELQTPFRGATQVSPWGFSHFLDVADAGSQP